MEWHVILDDVKLMGYKWADKGDGTFLMTREAQKVPYEISLLETETCTCKDHEYRGRNCKHIMYLLGKVENHRISRGMADTYVEILGRYLSKMADVTAYIAGSYLRGRKTVKDLDYVLKVNKFGNPWVRPEDAAKYVMQHLPTHFHPSLNGGRIIRGEIDNIPVDMYIAWPHEFGAMMMFLTGPAEFNVSCRTAANKRGWTLNQYGLYVNGTDTLVCDCSSEQPIFDALGIGYCTPAEREG